MADNGGIATQVSVFPGIILGRQNLKTVGGDMAENSETNSVLSRDP